MAASDASLRTVQKVHRAALISVKLMVVGSDAHGVKRALHIVNLEKIILVIFSRDLVIDLQEVR